MRRRLFLSRAVALGIASASPLHARDPGGRGQSCELRWLRCGLSCARA